MHHPSLKMMQDTIQVGRSAQEKGDYTIGSIIVRDDEVIASAHTQNTSQRFPLAHAEMLAIQQALEKIPSLEGCVLYTTLEPCPMCTGAALWSRCDSIVFGANKDDIRAVYQELYGTLEGLNHIDVSCSEIVRKSTHPLVVHPNYCREECVELLRLFL